MKKILILGSFLCIQLFSKAQSLELTPTKSTLKSTVGDQINLQTALNPAISGIRHSGTLNSPGAAASQTSLLRVVGKGHNGTSFTTERAGMVFSTTQLWTPTANGTEISFFTTPNNSITPAHRMKITNDGRVGIGTASPAYTLDVAGRINSNTGFSINGVAISPGYYYSSPWMTITNGSVDEIIDGTCIKARKLIVPELTSAMINQATVLVYMKVGGLGPYMLPYLSDAGGATNQVYFTLRTAGEITMYRHTLNSCRYSSSTPESYPGEPVMINLPASLEYRIVISRP